MYRLIIATNIKKVFFVSYVLLLFCSPLCLKRSRIDYKMLKSFLLKNYIIYKIMIDKYISLIKN